MDFTILHFAIHIVWRANVICTCRKSGIARKTTVAYPELRLNGADVLPQTTDWEDAIHRTALMQTYTIGLSKGTENGTSSYTISWLDHDGVVKGTDYRKLNSRFSTDYGFLDNRLKAGGNVTINWWKAHYMPGGAEENAVK